MSERRYGHAPGPALQAGTLRACFYPNGGLRELAAGDVRLNRGAGNALEGGLERTYVRVWHCGKPVHAAAVTGPGAGVAFGCDGEVACWRSTVEDVEVLATWRLRPDGWWREVRLRNTARLPRQVDVIFGQDVGLATDAALFSNEAYVAQYLDHRLAIHPVHGRVIQTRQNLAQKGMYPWLVQGVVGGARGFCTDGFDFFGRSCRLTGEPVCLSAKRLCSRVRQYEFAYIGLQSRTLRLRPGAATSVRAFALFVADHPRSSSDADNRRLAIPPENEATSREPLTYVTPTWARRSVPLQESVPARLGDVRRMVPWLEARELSERELTRQFAGGWRHVERSRQGTLSFVHGADTHVVLKAKEAEVWRAHGWILCREGRVLPREDVGSATCWMAGVFLSQYTMGNTVFNRLLPIVRDPLNIVRLTGLRAMVQVGGSWRWLGVPSFFAMLPGACRWFYALGGTDAVEVRVALDGKNGAARINVRVAGRSRAVRLVMPLMCGEPRDMGTGRARLEAHGILEMTPARESPMRRRHPRAQLRVEPTSGTRVRAEWIEVPRSTAGAMAVMWQAPAAVCEWGLTLSAQGLGAQGLRRTVGLRPPVLRGGTARIERVGDVLPWMAAQARIHMAAPRGLEQYSGGAWGTRDACQGPMDVLLALGQDAAAAEVLKTLFSAQQPEGTWPQWFMLPPYETIRSDHAHGDVVLWPLAALCEYVQETGDLAILDARVPAMGQGREGAETVASRVRRLLKHVKGQFVPGTRLLRYGLGDWDDSLQPAHCEDAGRLVSSWTVALSYEVLSRYAEILARRGAHNESDELASLAEGVRQDFHRYLMRDGVAAGFGRFEGNRRCTLLLHPTDRVTGIRYRLLPMTRGVISGLFTPVEAAAHLELIRRKLLAPDGVRLMDRPAAYRGGRTTHFQRAESAAFFGREIGLMYVHAHLRYVQALARVGAGKEAWEALARVNPIGLRREVPQADRRQANLYFSSSDAAFPDRYAAGRRYAEARRGTVEVRGGWRVYSSGPGLFVRRVVADLLGLRRWYGAPVLDPCLSRACDGMQVETEWVGRRVVLSYRVGAEGTALGPVMLDGRPAAGQWRVTSPYRSPGFCLDPAAWGRTPVDGPLHLSACVGGGASPQ